MKKNYLLVMALAALVSCSSDEFVGDSGSPNGVNGSGDEKAISFNLNVPTVTRSEKSGSDAAGILGYQFIVWGEKNEATTGTMGQAAGTGDLVFQNYLVNYAASTAYKTTSNTKDWEYVGLKYDVDGTDGYSPSYSAHVSPLTSTATSEGQKIKYWDYSATNYVFTAVSALKDDIKNGYVSITKIQSDATNHSNFNKGYTVTLTANAHPENLYFSDRQVINQGTGTNREAANAYGGNVTLKFRNAISQIRVGMYETLPGHKVKIDKFYYADNANPTFSTMSTAKTDAFYANVPNITTSTGVTLTVTYQSSGAALNNPKISVGGTTANDFIKLGANIMNATELKTTSADPTWDTSGGTYTKMFSQEANNKNLKLKVDYTLTATDTGEKIEVKGATAEIPAEYLKWKPNYKYTYLFKISDNSNGSTGGDVVGLYPITFDAVAVVSADGGTAEYITTVSEPSITTFGVKGGKYVGGKNEYETGTDIYITIVKESSVINPVFMSDTHLYKVTTSDATNFPITEASVAEAYEHKAGNKITFVGSGCICTPWSNDGKASKVTSVPAEDGTSITMNALKFSPAAGDEGTYAVQYSYGSDTYIYTAVTGLVDGNPVSGYYESDGASTPTYTLTSDVTYDSTSGKTYYDRIPSGTETKRVYKIIKVVAP